MTRRSGGGRWPRVRISSNAMAHLIDAAQLAGARPRFDAQARWLDPFAQMPTTMPSHSHSAVVELALMAATRASTLAPRTMRRACPYPPVPQGQGSRTAGMRRQIAHLRRQREVDSLGVG